MRKLMLWTIAAVFFMTNVVEAGPPWFTTVGKIIRIGTGLVGEGLYVTLDTPTHDTNTACNQSNMLFMERASTQYQETLSIVLTALAQARPIDVFYDGTCHGGAVNLFAVAVRTNP